ncbi:lipase family protein [Sorangium sp. So ce1078]|uniref:lipase family protein n=1 Tax=Sorangium sp. So ce1078 TaxID=3133329 RepID=UPI003F5FC975
MRVEAAFVPVVDRYSVAAESITGKADNRIINNLLQVRQGLYEREAALIMATAASWSYSDVTTFADVMSRCGFGGGNAVSINLQNDALLVGTTAFLLQSADRRVVVLSFRGTEPRSVINWLGNINAKVEPFHAMGHVHGGFYRPLLALWPTLSPLLGAALRGMSLCDVSQRAMEKYRCRPAGTDAAISGEVAEPDYDDERDSRAPMFSKAGASRAGDAPATGEEDEPALYITGHSLGAALAVLAAARLYTVSILHEWHWKKLRGIYTFGQPMVGNQEFARRYERGFGHMLFRHIYKRDVVPRMPPLTAGNFRHIGEEYHATDQAWVYQSKLVSQARSFVGSTLTGVTAFLMDQLAGIPVLARIPFPYSWEAHSPVNYLRVSQMSLAATGIYGL